MTRLNLKCQVIKFVKTSIDLLLLLAPKKINNCRGRFYRKTAVPKLLLPPLISPELFYAEISQLIGRNYCWIGLVTYYAKSHTFLLLLVQASGLILFSKLYRRKRLCMSLMVFLTWKLVREGGLFENFPIWLLNVQKGIN